LKILVYGDPQFGASGDFSYPSSTGYTTRLDTSLAICYWISELVSKNKPDFVINLGDVFEQMQVVDSLSLSAAAEGMGVISRATHDVGGRHYVLLGNHDLSNQSRTIFSSNFLNYYPSTEVVSDFKTLDSEKIAFVPFSEEVSTIESYLDSLSEDFMVFSHIDLKNVQFSFVSGYYSDFGVDVEKLKRFRLVVNGHIHTPRMISDNFVQLGSLQQFTHDQLDKELPRSVLLVDDGKLNFIPNTLAPRIVKVKSVEELDQYSNNSYIIFENVEGVDEKELLVLLSRFSKFRIVGSKALAQPIQSYTLRSDTPEELFKEYLSTVSMSLDRDILEREGLEVISIVKSRGK
jgi:DNA repair exonuclease SbcCD nuclease subunit